MTTKKAVPRRLYKYSSFSGYTLDALIANDLYFANPRTFNDPLDTKPCLETDLESDELEQILRILITQRIKEEMTAAAKTMKIKGPRSLEHIETHSQSTADRIIAEIRYQATDPDYDMQNPEQFLFGKYMEDELIRRYDRGVFSLAENSDCPLMWSHYVDQHKGICIGYSVPENEESNLHKVVYGGKRFIKASMVASMLRGDDSARIAVDKSVLARKAHNWRYEREWRLVGRQGSQDSPLQLKEVIFGMRCSDAIKFAVAKALQSEDLGIKFYEIRERRGQFLLGRERLNTDELFYILPRRYLDMSKFFEPVIENESGA